VSVISVALIKLNYFYFKEKQINRFTYTKVVKIKRFIIKERNRAFKAQIAILVYLFYFKKVYKKGLFKRISFY